MFILGIPIPIYLNIEIYLCVIFVIYFLIMIYIRLQLFRAWCDGHRRLSRCRWCKNHRHRINTMIWWNIAEKSIDDGDFTMFRWNGKTIRYYHFFHRRWKNFPIISLNRSSPTLYVGHRHWLNFRCRWYNEIMLNIQKNGLTNLETFIWVYNIASYKHSAAFMVTNNIIYINAAN